MSFRIWNDMGVRKRPGQKPDFSEVAAVGRWRLAAGRPLPWKRAGAAPDRAGVGGWGKRSGGGLPTRPRRFTGLGGRAFLPRRFWPRRFLPAGRMAPRWSWPNRGVVLLLRGEGGCVRLDRGGGAGRFRAIERIAWMRRSIRWISSADSRSPPPLAARPWEISPNRSANRSVAAWGDGVVGFTRR